MEIGKTYKHIRPDLHNATCVVVEHTNRGCKVMETVIIGRKKPKPKTQFYDKAHFVGEGAIWVKVN